VIRPITPPVAVTGLCIGNVYDRNMKRGSIRHDDASVVFVFHRSVYAARSRRLHIVYQLILINLVRDCAAIKLGEESVHSSGILPERRFLTESWCGAWLLW
jgi:hypothetical protein